MIITSQVLQYRKGLNILQIHNWPNRQWWEGWGMVTIAHTFGNLHLYSNAMPFCGKGLSNRAKALLEDTFLL